MLIQMLIFRCPKCVWTIVRRWLIANQWWISIYMFIARRQTVRGWWMSIYMFIDRRQTADGYTRVIDVHLHAFRLLTDCVRMLACGCTHWRGSCSSACFSLTDKLCSLVGVCVHPYYQPTNTVQTSVGAKYSNWDVIAPLQTWMSHVWRWGGGASIDTSTLIS